MTIQLVIMFVKVYLFPNVAQVANSLNSDL